jgi:hypothetical protein
MPLACAQRLAAIFFEVRARTYVPNSFIVGTVLVDPMLAGNFCCIAIAVFPGAGTTNITTPVAASGSTSKEQATLASASAGIRAWLQPCRKTTRKIGL